MKKVLYLIAVMLVAFTFSGCNSTKSTTPTGNTDNADSAIIDESVISEDAADVNNPPVPPEPQRPE